MCENFHVLVVHHKLCKGELKPIKEMLNKVQNLSRYLWMGFIINEGHTCMVHKFFLHVELFAI